MIENIELINKQIEKLTKEIANCRKKIDANRKYQEQAEYGQQLFNKIARGIEDYFSDFVSKKKRDISCVNPKFEKKYTEGLKQVINSSLLYKNIGELGENSQKLRRMYVEKSEEISQWKQTIKYLEDELMLCKNNLGKVIK